MSTEPLLLVGALLLLGGVFLSKTSSRFGVPSLLLFLGLGMLTGSEGIVGVEFDDFELAQRFGVVALAFILFAGGTTTSWPSVRPVLFQGVALASVGVVLSALVLGISSMFVLGLGLDEAMLLGAIVASTDAAAVFSILRSKGIGIQGGLKPLLELESGSNDPAAVFLTVGMVGLIEADGTGLAGLAGGFVFQMVFGALAGLVLARLAVRVINHVTLDYDGLYPVLMLAFVLLTFEGTALLGGSGFLAVYVAGLSLADSEFLHKRSLFRFHDALAWLMQIAMFVLLGLLVFPSRLPDVALPALAVAFVLMFVARPLAVFVTLLPFRMPWRHTAFVSWVGLRGAAPIILATFPVVAGVEGAEVIFNVVFFVVLTSVLCQGTTIAAAARIFDVDAPEDEEGSYALEAVLSGDAGPDLHEVVVDEGSLADGTTIVNLGLPPEVLVVLLQRGADWVVPQGGTVVRAGDHLLVMAEGDNLDAMRQVTDLR